MLLVLLDVWICCSYVLLVLLDVWICCRYVLLVLLDVWICCSYDLANGDTEGILQGIIQGVCHLGSLWVEFHLLLRNGLQFDWLFRHRSLHFQQYISSCCKITSKRSVDVALLTVLKSVYSILTY